MFRKQSITYIGGRLWRKEGIEFFLEMFSVLDCNNVLWENVLLWPTVYESGIVTTAVWIDVDDMVVFALLGEEVTCY